MSTEGPYRDLIPGSRVHVTTHDGHIFSAKFVEVRKREGREDVAVLRFDTGWITSYPVSMVSPVEKPGDLSDRLLRDSSRLIDF